MDHYLGLFNTPSIYALTKELGTCKRWDVLSRGNGAYGSYLDSVNKAMLATNLYIKYRLTGKETLLHKIAVILPEIKEEETEILIQLLMI